ncbi:MAG: glycosyl transferase family 1, partial [Chloroflexota bacterium]
MKVLMACYACEPGKGSEPGVGWNWALQAAKVAEVWVLTRANNRPAIEAALACNAVPNLHFVYHDLPGCARFWKRGQRGVYLYYLLWQLAAVPVLRRLHQEIHFDLGHQVTFVSFRIFSPLALVGFPYIWGPLAGGDRIPVSFLPALGAKAMIRELVRELSNRLIRVDPLVRLTARNARLIL